MSAREQLNSYIRQVERRLRLGTAARGAATLTFAALVTTIILVLVANAFGFSETSVASTRVILILALLTALVYAIALPLLFLDRQSAATKAEDAFPKFKQRLMTFAERDPHAPDAAAREPFMELLAADTLDIARTSETKRLVPNRTLFVSLGIGIASLGVLIWMIAAGPGYLGYGAGLLWTGVHADTTPFYDIHVSPGDASVRRNADELVTAQPVGLQTDKMRLYARYESASKWEQVAMQPQPGGSGFQFLFAGLPEGVEYYVEAGPIRSRHFKIRVVDLPSVKQIRVTYRYPSWTGMHSSVDEHGGDLRAVEGTTADLEVLTDRPLRNGVLVLDDGRQVQLSAEATAPNHYTGSLTMAKDGSYHLAAVDQGQPVRLSEDFFIEADKANPPEVAVVRPARDYRASPIEEVTIAANANDPFGVSAMMLHYSVNGGDEKTVNLLKQKGAKDADGSTVLSLEDFKLAPGDLVSFYVTAKDARAEAHTGIYFIQVDPFEREFSQAQSGGGGGGGGQADQNDISDREKEIIAQTWKLRSDNGAPSEQSADQGKFLSEVQAKLRDQAIALSGRLQMRDLTEQNDEFNSFQRDMSAAADAMNPASDHLRKQKWSEALPSEQKALQHLLQAEATFRQIQVAFGTNGGGGRGGGAGRDLASLFDLELDTQKNQYETAQTASSADQRQKDIDDALKKLDELARREQDLANQRNNGSQSFQQRWQQEMLRRDAEQLLRQMEQLAQQQSQQNGQQSGQSSSAQSSSGQSSGQLQSQSQSQGQGASGSSEDQRVQQALEQLREANQDMQRAQQEQNDAEARRAADRLRDATNLLGSMQQQQASGRLDSMAGEADRLAAEQRDQTDRMRKLLEQATSGDTSSEASQQNLWNQANGLARDRQQLADDLARLEKQARDAERDLASTQRGAASKLRDALGNLDQDDLQTRLQRSADWLRRGAIDPNSLSAESGVSSDLQRFSDQVRQAQQALGAGQQQDQGQDAQAAIDRLERLRNQMAGITRDRGTANGGQQGSRPGSQQGGQLDRDGRSGESGQFARNGQPGQDAGELSRNGGPGGNAGPAVGQVGDDYTRGQRYGGARGGNNNWWIDTGNNSNLPQPVSPDNSPLPPDPERSYQQSLDGLNQLRQAVGSDPETERELQELIREMQQLDPKRFPGNPALFEQLHTQVLSDVDKLELQLQRKLDDKQSGQIRSSSPMPMPSGYQDAVADYFRRLSKNP
jgi:hypothetical protein